MNAPLVFLEVSAARVLGDMEYQRGPGGKTLNLKTLSLIVEVRCNHPGSAPMPSLFLFNLSIIICITSLKKFG